MHAALHSVTYVPTHCKRDSAITYSVSVVVCILYCSPTHYTVVVALVKILKFKFAVRGGGVVEDPLVTHTLFAKQQGTGVNDLEALFLL
jgi:hypothetical protein